jgi:hypothetical protein
MKYFKLCALCVFLGVFTASNATILSDFQPFLSNDDITRGFATGNWSFNTTPAGVEITGLDSTGNFVDYYFGGSSFSISLEVNTNLALTANMLPTNSALSFKINLMDLNNAFAYYTVSTSLLPSSASSTPLILSVGLVDSGFEWSKVQGFKLVGLSQEVATDKQFAISISNLSTSPIPEPATYAALLGLGGLGFAVYLRRRSVA